VRIGVLGLGVRSHIAEHAHRPAEGARVTAVCDTHADRVAVAQEKYGPGVEGFTDWRDLLASGIDAVFVVTPDDTHEELAVAALRAGVATFVEKPLAISTEGADHVLEVAGVTGTPLYVGHNMRHMPMVLTMRQLIEQGAIGDVKAIWCRHFVGHGGDFYFRDWHADRRRTMGLLLQKGAHDIDVIHWLAGGYSRQVSAIGGLMVYGDVRTRTDRSGQLLHDWFRPHDPGEAGALDSAAPVADVEDLSMVQMRLDNGVLASYQQCHFAPDYWRNYTIIGTRGRLENFGDVDPGAVVKVWQKRSGYRADAEMLVDVPVGEGTHGGADVVLVDEFLRFVRGGGPTRTSPIAAREAVAAGCAATESLRNGGRQTDVTPPAADVLTYFSGGHADFGGPASAQYGSGTLAGRKEP
jgi:predicted dehydrogenase